MARQADAEGGDEEKGGKLHEKKAPEKIIQKPSFLWEGPPALVVVGGAGLTIGSRQNLKPGRTVVGREPACDLPVFDGSVSRKHAEIGLGDDGSVSVTDLGSTHGTFVNDVRLTAPALLADGDYLRCGNVVWKFRTAKLTAEPSKKVETKTAPKPAPKAVPAAKPSELPTAATGPMPGAKPSEQATIAAGPAPTRKR